MPQLCALCERGCEFHPGEDVFDCKNCGTYRLTPELWQETLKGAKSAIRQALRGVDVVSELAVFIHDETSSGRIPVLGIGRIRATKSLSVVERLDRALARLASRRTRPNQQEEVLDSEYLRLGAYDKNDAEGLLDLLAEQQLISRQRHMTKERLVSWVVALTATGWTRAAELTRVTTGRQAFVAMAFTHDMMKIRSDAFDPAIRAAGYEPFLVSDREHNGRIDDRIEYEIKNSVFVVADFTEHRGGVYYEAGFAQGLGKPVIWTVEKGHVEKLHFDTRQFNHIVWSDAEELRTRLEARILNTVGKGPLA